MAEKAQLTVKKPEAGEVSLCALVHAPDGSIMAYSVYYYPLDQLDKVLHEPHLSAVLSLASGEPKLPTCDPTPGFRAISEAQAAV